MFSAGAPTVDSYQISHLQKVPSTGVFPEPSTNDIWGGQSFALVSHPQLNIDWKKNAYSVEQIWAFLLKSRGLNGPVSKCSLSYTNQLYGSVKGVWNGKIPCSINVTRTMLIDLEVKSFDKDKTMKIKWVFFDKGQTKQEQNRREQYPKSGTLSYISCQKLYNI